MTNRRSERSSILDPRSAREGDNLEEPAEHDTGSTAYHAISIEKLLEMSVYMERSPLDDDIVNELREKLSKFPINYSDEDFDLKKILIEGVISYTADLAQTQIKHFNTPIRRTGATELRDMLLALAASLEQAHAVADACPARGSVMMRSFRSALSKALRSTTDVPTDVPKHRQYPLPDITRTTPVAFLAAWAASLRNEAGEIDVPRGRTPGDDLRIDFICRSLAICWFRITRLPPRHAQGPIKNKGTFTEFALLLMPLILPGVSPQQIRTATRRVVDEFKRDPTWLIAGRKGSAP